MNNRDSTELAWSPGRLAAVPMLADLAPFAAALPADRWPVCAELNTAFAARAGVRFVPPTDDGLDYEARVAARSEVATREGNWHDLFNALMWAAFPRAKRALSRRHAAGRGQEARAGTRGAARDAATVLDESGVIFACANPALATLLRGFQWQELFVAQRAAVLREVRCLLFGHALAEKALTPYVGMTGHAVILDMPAAVLASAPAALGIALDECLAAWLADPVVLASPRDLQPLPVLGVPGWWPANADPAFYDNPEYFRPGRRRDL
ncbi:MAG: DUF3025 domain-containing protein [Burkholderiales bacterium]